MLVLQIIFSKKYYRILKRKKKFVFLIIFSILSLSIINIFYRLAEHGTDRSAQILILILVLELFKLINTNITQKKIDLSKLLILCTMIISLKVFYFIYLSVFFFVVIFYQKNLSLFFFKSNK